MSDEFSFDFAALDKPGFKEDAVREEIIAPMLRKAGYQATGPLRVERSKSLLHPFVMLGSKKHRINIVPDYTLYEDSTPLLVLEAKSPDEPVVNSVHVEQAYSYAIHPEVRCAHFALCNGRKLSFYHINQSDPLSVFNCKEMYAQWDNMEKYLLPRYLKMPVLREFYPDFGFQAKKMGISRDEELPFDGFMIQLLMKSAWSHYTAICTCNVGGLECMCSFDFSLDALKIILESLPAPQSAQIVNALERAPYNIDLDAKVSIYCKARLGEIIQGPHEEFIPMIVTSLSKVEYDPSKTVGPQDAEAFRNRVK